jgi:cytochrome c oxidase cbb3-type subunit 3
MTISSAPALAPLLATLLFAVSACDRQPTAALTEWTPADHHNAAQPPRGTVPAEPATSAEPGPDNVLLIAWKNNCTTCHGPVGRGDGPQGRMLKVRDLSDPDWQASVTDEQIAAVIRSGKGKMPAFQLPETTLLGLVRLVRQLGPAGPSGASTGEAGSTPARGGASGASVGGSGPQEHAAEPETAVGGRSPAR